jgi:hypothetical protein
MIALHTIKKIQLGKDIGNHVASDISDLKVLFLLEYFSQ